MNKGIQTWINDHWSKLQSMYNRSGRTSVMDFDEFALKMYRELYEANLLKSFDNK